MTLRESYKFTQNRACEYFPCHDIDEDKMNCLFCYCPLYALKNECGGNPNFLKNGIISCEDCIAPHDGEKGWDFVNSKMGRIMELGKVKK
jgi:Zn-finger protein